MSSPGSGPRSGGPRRTLRIGITGPIGCGKSTIAGWLGELGAVVIDADVVAREVVEPGSPALAAVLEAFGPGVRRPDGSLDRARLGQIVFADPAALARLEAIVHPAVRPRILDAIAAAEAAGASAVAIEAIKLVEGGLAAQCDEVWLVTCDPSAQRQRLTARGLDPERAGERIDAQGDLGARLRGAAARVIDTSGGLAETRAAVGAAWAEARAGAG
ncbi:MAG TPA: dephospho-CoA kinase [Candidatus Acidoferrales bacterium]|nr:dephospho-CoA kinase [Candidatus Acidoferrales bacterium]